jgi:hypothetical protein
MQIGVSCYSSKLMSDLRRKTKMYYFFSKSKHYKKSYNGQFFMAVPTQFLSILYEVGNGQLLRIYDTN